MAFLHIIIFVAIVLLGRCMITSHPMNKTWGKSMVMNYTVTAGPPYVRLGVAQTNVIGGEVPVLQWHIGMLAGTHELCLCIPDDHELFHFTETSHITLNSVAYGCTCKGREDDPWYLCNRD